MSKIDFSVDRSVGRYGNPDFIKRNGHLIVVAEKDELRDLLKWPDRANYSSDVALLLNSRRLDFADPKVVADIIRKRFAERNVPSHFEGLTDEQIFDAIKSRHIQSLSELDSYSEYLAASLDSSISEAAQRAIADKAVELKEEVTE